MKEIAKCYVYCSTLTLAISLLIINAAMTYKNNPFRGYFALHYDLGAYYCDNERNDMDGCLLENTHDNRVYMKDTNECAIKYDLFLKCQSHFNEDDMQDILV